MVHPIGLIDNKLVTCLTFHSVDFIMIASIGHLHSSHKHWSFHRVFIFNILSSRVYL